MKHPILTLATLLAAALNIFAAPEIPGAEKLTYKTIGDTNLSLFVFKPEGHQAADKRPAIVFYHGGGWRGGNPGALMPQCRYLAARGMVAISVQYRLAPAVKVDGCVRDARSALRWVRAHAAELGIDPDRIAAGGGSAGGHLAAAIATLDGFDEPGEDLKISARPNALVLFNPAVILAPVDGVDIQPNKPTPKEPTISERLGVEAKTVSPYHHIKPGLPPALIMHGTADTTVPFRVAEMFTEAMKKAGNRCELVPYKDQTHSFFNLGKSRENFIGTMQDTDKFLASLGWLQGPPTVAGMVDKLR
ncbi:MAG: alpha/beta hydrolase [Verrucomicrobia bacterium]|nr:alpha/beta hydrolase [Verrucomicrobiota bacterium]